MGKPIHLETADYHLYDLLEYQLGKAMDETIFEQFPALVQEVNKEEPRRYSDIDLLADDAAKLPGGSYVQVAWELRVITPEEGAELEKERDKEND